MNNYSDIIQVLGAMILVSLLVTNANRSSFLNKKLVIEGEYETEVTAIAQDIMEESRARAFDETTTDGYVPVNIPQDFSALGTDSNENATDRSNFDDFDDYKGWTSTISTVHGDFEVSVDVYYLDKTTRERSETKTSLKKLDITLKSGILTNYNSTTQKKYQFSYIRSYYAD